MSPAIFFCIYHQSIVLNLEISFSKIINITPINQIQQRITISTKRFKISSQVYTEDTTPVPAPPGGPPDRSKRCRP